MACGGEAGASLGAESAASAVAAASLAAAWLRLCAGDAGADGRTETLLDDGARFGDAATLTGVRVPAMGEAEGGGGIGETRPA